MSLPMRTPRGFTLLELTVTLAVSSFALALVLMTFQSQQRAFEAIEVGRAGQEIARDATLTLERTLRRAGFGIDPRVAFDMRTFKCASVPCRDKTDGSDELVFVARTARYRIDPTGGTCTDANGCPQGQAWRASSVTATSLVLKGRAGDRFRRGQLLQLLCPGSTINTMATVSVTTGALAADGLIAVNLTTAVAGDPYQSNVFTDACYSSGAVTVFAVDRFRYYVDASYGVPYLMLDTGVDQSANNVIGAEDLIPIARGVEDLQVAYVLNDSPNFTAPDNGTDWVVGNTSGTVEEPDPTIANPPDYQTIDEDARRYTRHPANIRAVRVSLGVRSLRPDPGPPSGWAGDTFGPVDTTGAATARENRNAYTEYAPDADSARTGVQPRLRRYQARTTVSVRNLGSRALFLF